MPSRYLAPVQAVHWVDAAPVHSEQSPWQLVQVLSPVLANVLVGQVNRHVVPLRYLAPEQVRQLELVELLQVVHSAWQGSH